MNLYLIFLSRLEGCIIQYMLNVIWTCPDVIGYTEYTKKELILNQVDIVSNTEDRIFSLTKKIFFLSRKIFLISRKYFWSQKNISGLKKTFLVSRKYFLSKKCTWLRKLDFLHLSIFFWDNTNFLGSWKYCIVRNPTDIFLIQC